MFFYDTHYYITREVTFGTFGSLFCALIANKSAFWMFHFCYDEAGPAERFFEFVKYECSEIAGNASKLSRMV